MAPNDEHLVSLVQDKKELYDKSNPLYKFQGRKTSIWEQIGKELRTSGEVCRRRCLALRDRYGREARKSEAPSGSGAEYQRPWYLLESMSFLRPPVIPRPIGFDNHLCPNSYLMAELYTFCTFFGPCIFYIKYIVEIN
ncbi:transcription factor Adf-1-like [Anastrepha obliqua]|uniref:transcription factor Adf-1-like n=1 Tax=Anastrepha obliqua TaxID=95512 RepID=UPI002409FFFB|nr:transcription factor Adf-1-like [Anastrepha obliqua]